MPTKIREIDMKVPMHGLNRGSNFRLYSRDVPVAVKSNLAADAETGNLRG